MHLRAAMLGLVSLSSGTSASCLVAPVPTALPTPSTPSLPQASTAQDSTPLPQLQGTVLDPSGALVPGAKLHFEPATSSTPSATPAAGANEAVTDGGGHFTIALPPGSYKVTISAEGFAPLTRTVAVGARPSPLSLRLANASAAVEVDVPADNTASTGNEDNKSALVFKGAQLDALSSSDSLMQQQIMSMAGGSGEGGGQFYVDGFSSGRFPPKDTIREIRINQNPFSAQYQDLGYGRVEIFTKPGSDKLHGNFFSAGNTKALNSRNPYTGDQPPYFLLFNRADLNGPLGKKTSFFVNFERSDLQNNAVVNALNPDGSELSLAVAAPNTEYTVAGRLDRQLGKNNTLVGRYEYSSTTALNNGVGLLVLPSQGTTNGTVVQTAQVGNTALLGPNTVSETRFQYLRTRINQTPNSTAPTINVQGSFNGGGAPVQGLTDDQDQFEFQEYLSFSRGNHFLRVGARYRLLHELNTSTANYNGAFTFADLAAYRAGTPNLFSLTAGQTTASLITGDLGAYAEDEWKVNKNLTATFGLRLESQSAIPDHVNPAPRAGISWAIGQTDKHPPVIVLRASAGVFYDRFAAGNILTSIRQNGISQQQFLITNPTFYPVLPSPGELSGTPSTPYGISRNLRVSSENIASLSAEKALGKLGSITATYYAVRGVHLYNSTNINAPGFNGVRPLNTTGDVYQFSSDGIMKAQSFALNTNLQLSKRFSLFAFYSARRQYNDTFGATSFPSQPNNVSADYGPSGLGYQPVGQRLFADGSVKLPFSFSLDAFLGMFSRSRFNITTGTDRNGDTQFNDRPAFATAPGPTSLIYNTPYGKFDANPQPGEDIIPYNYALGPRTVFFASELQREWKFGPREKAPPPPPNLKPGQKPPQGDPRYNLRFGLDAANILNTNNAGTPIGVLSSRFFGQSISSSSFFSPTSGANRLLFLYTSFRF